MPAESRLTQEKIMAKIHGISGSTQYLLNGTKAINGKKLATLEDINYFYNNYEKILAETEITVKNQQDAIILGLSNDELRLDKQLKEGITRRTTEVDGKINELNFKVETTEKIFKKLSYKLQYWIHLSLRNHRINSPFADKLRELQDLQYRKANLIASKPVIIHSERQKVVDTYAFLTEKKSFFIGAKGEELVIKYLAQLSDEYHVLNDVNLRFHPPIHWRERDESIITSQIDHIVIGPTGVFLLETKNWKPSDIEIQSDKLVYQVRRSSLALWYYLKDYYRQSERPKIRNVIVSMQGSQPSRKLDKYIDVVTPDQLCDYIIRRKITLSVDLVKKLVEILLGTNQINRRRPPRF